MALQCANSCSLMAVVSNKCMCNALLILFSVVLCIGYADSSRCCERTSAYWRNSISQLPVIIGHRGAPSHRPEHTLISYELAIDLGADFIELDLVSTKDHILIARHENEISNTTDIEDHTEFADRRTTKEIDGKEITGWFTEDFTLEEIKTLKAKERLPKVRPQNTPFDELQIPTLEEAIQLAKNYSVGLYPETKHPAYFASIGLPLEEKLVEVLQDNGYVSADDKVFIQSFSAESLIKLRSLTNLSLIQLIGNDSSAGNMTSLEGLAQIALYAQGIGPAKSLLFVKDESNNNSNEASPLINDAHKMNLLVHPWTFRNENQFLPENYRLGNSSTPDYQRSLGNSPTEYCDYFCLGIDGLFTDSADTAAAVRSKIFNPAKINCED